jgi:hypothetical protein
MPAFSEPNRRYKIILEADKDKEAAIQTVFFARSVTFRTHRKIAELVDRTNTESLDSYFDDTKAALSLVLVGWKNFKHPETGEDIPFDIDKVEDYLTATEAYQIVSKSLYNDSLEHEEKKS